MPVERTVLLETYVEGHVFVYKDTEPCQFKNNYLYIDLRFSPFP